MRKWGRILKGILLKQTLLSPSSLPRLLTKHFSLQSLWPRQQRERERERERGERAQ